MKGYMMLEDGAVLEGKAFGDDRTVFGEMQCHTVMAGYEELLIDPANAGQILLMTYPLIGNVGLNTAEKAINGPFPAALIVKDYAETPSHYQCESSLSGFLKSKGIFGLSYVDTRMLGRKVRAGNVKCCLTTSEPDNTTWERLRRFLPEPLSAPGGVRKKTVAQEGKNKRMSVIDLGSSGKMLAYLAAQDCHVVLHPFDAAPEDILSENPHIVLVSNGGGDPDTLADTMSTLQKITGMLPIFGVGLGAVILGKAQGMPVYKMASAHRGGNYAVRCVETGKVRITEQNIGYAVKKTPGITVTHAGVNDDVIEGYAAEGFAGRTYLPEQQEFFEWIGGKHAAQ